MGNKKIASGLALFGTFCTLSLSASEQATTNTEASKIAPQIFQKVGAYWKFIAPKNVNDVSKEKVEELITKNNIDALELDGSVSLFDGPGKGIKKLLFNSNLLWPADLQKLIPNAIEDFTLLPIHVNRAFV